MNKKIFIENFNKVHFIGIGGVSMSALAKYCLSHRVCVSGSDRSLSEEVILLRSLGAEIRIGHGKTLPQDVDAVVYTSAVGDGNPELQFARKNNIPLFKRSEFLGEIVAGFENSVAICGSHGKTTTTAMLSDIFINAGYNPTVFLGGEGKSFGNFNRGGEELVILEACEYKKNFLDIKPNFTVVTNIDNDHLDCYSGIDEEIATVRQFIKDSLAFINMDNENSSALCSVASVSYGINSKATYLAKNIKGEDSTTSFALYAYGRRLGRIKLPLRGMHNVYNALSASAFAIDRKIPFTVVKRSLEKFEGVKRRDEFIGEFNGVRYFCDYAHHPSEISSILSAEREKDQTLYVFQPHTFSRTKYLMDDFTKVLKEVKNLIIYKTYPAREKFSSKGSARALYKSIREVNKEVKYCQNQRELKKEIEGFNGINKVYFVGAGDLSETVLKKNIKKNI